MNPPSNFSSRGVLRGVSNKFIPRLHHLELIRSKVNFPFKHENLKREKKRKNLKHSVDAMLKVFVKHGVSALNVKHGPNRKKKYGSYCAGRTNKVATSCSKPLSNHRQKSSKKHVFHAIFDPRGATLELFFEGFPMSNDKTERLNRKRIIFYIGLCGVTFFSGPKSRCATSF